MNWDVEAIQQKVVDLGKGLFCIQYKDAEDQASPPRVVVKPVSGHENSVELLLHSGCERFHFMASWFQFGRPELLPQPSYRSR